MKLNLNENLVNVGYINADQLANMIKHCNSDQSSLLHLGKMINKCTSQNTAILVSYIKKKVLIGNIEQVYFYDYIRGETPHLVMPFKNGKLKNAVSMLCS